MNETTYLKARANNGTINSTQLFRNLMMNLPPMNNMPINNRTHGNHICYRLRRPRRQITGGEVNMHLSPPIAMSNTIFPTDRSSLWRACYASYSTYRNEHDKLTSDEHDDDSVSNSNGMDASLNASAYTSTSFATIEPTMHDMHTLCHAMLTSGSQVLVFVGDGSAHHHRMIFNCKENEGLSLMSLLVAEKEEEKEKEERIKRKREQEGEQEGEQGEEQEEEQGEEPDRNDVGNEKLAVDSSELVGRWSRQCVRSSLFPLSSSSALITTAHVQHILGTCAQSISLGNGSCPYYIDNELIDVTELDALNVVCLVWRVTTVSDSSFVFSAQRITKISNSVTTLNSLEITIKDDVVIYNEVGSDETSEQKETVETPLPVMLSRYIQKWTSGDGDNNGQKRKKFSSKQKSNKKKKTR